MTYKREASVNTAPMRTTNPDPMHGQNNFPVWSSMYPTNRSPRIIPMPRTVRNPATASSIWLLSSYDLNDIRCVQNNMSWRKGRIHSKVGHEEPKTVEKRQDQKHASIVYKVAQSCEKNWADSPVSYHSDSHSSKMIMRMNHYNSYLTLKFVVTVGVYVISIKLESSIFVFEAEEVSINSARDDSWILAKTKLIYSRVEILVYKREIICLKKMRERERQSDNIHILFYNFYTILRLKETSIFSSYVTWTCSLYKKGFLPI